MYRAGLFCGGNGEFQRGEEEEEEEEEDKTLACCGTIAHCDDPIRRDAKRIGCCAFDAARRRSIMTF
jgi:hypothetical protein